MSEARLPLAGLRVLDFGHTVMGPSCTLVLADLGADVIKIEPAPNGDPTRELKGFGSGYFGYFNRNKRSLAVNLKQEAGREVVGRLIDRSDVLVENFAPGTMERLGLGYPQVQARNPRLVYASLKGFLDGPYRERLALDEVIQMMTGLAYMTGPSGRPLRAGTSVVDITGGLFGVIGILVALAERDRTGTGQLVGAALFESSVFLMGQHLCYSARTDGPVPPMPERVSAWAIYDLFEAGDGRQVFVGITTDSHWRRFCKEAGWLDLAADPALATNSQRILARPRLLAFLRSMFSKLKTDEVAALCVRARIPFAPVQRPEDLFDDEHLQATGGLLATTLPSGEQTALPRLPIDLPEVEFTVRYPPPTLGEHTADILNEIGYDSAAIAALADQNSVVVKGVLRQHL